MPTTSGNLRYPASTDAVDVPGDIKKLADDVDTYKAPLASPTFTGTPAAPTAAADTDTTQVATTAYVLGQASSSNGAALGVAAAGTSKKYARADHVHAMPTASDVSAIAASLVDAAGDLLVGSADNTVGRLALGSNAQVLTVDTSGSGVAKVKWADAATGLPSQTSNANKLLTTNGTSASWTGVITNLVNLAPEERCNVVASAATGTININFLTASIWYYTTDASANHTINIRGDASNTLASLLATGDAITVVWIISNGTTAYYPTTIQIDGSSVTPVWLGGTKPPTASQANQTAGLDVFTFTIVKTAATPTYKVLGAWSQYR